MRLTALVLTASAAVMFGAACGSDGADEVEAYIDRANTIQEEAAPALRRANETYARFAAGEVSVERGPEELARAERSIRSTRAELAELEPPADARELHSRLLRFVEVNADLAHESTLLASYVPAAQEALSPVPRAGRRLGRRLRAAGEPAGQERALSIYRDSIDRALEDLRGLEPPRLLASSHERRVSRLESVRSLARRLGRAVRGRDSSAVARLLLRFRRLQDAGAESLNADAESLREYERRYRATREAAAAIGREQARLRRTLE